MALEKRLGRVSEVLDKKNRKAEDDTVLGKENFLLRENNRSFDKI